MDLELDAYKGPLDLLLHLIKKMEVDIYDIPIREITQQYMNYIEAMQTLELSIAGEYIVMASTLMAIKSQMLLPTVVAELEDSEFEDDENLDPRKALIEQLLEYRKYKYAAELLNKKEEERKLHFTKEPMNVEEFKQVEIPLPQTQYNTVDLFLAFHQMLQKKKDNKQLDTVIESEEITIEEKMNQVIAWLSTHETGKQGIQFENLFESSRNKNEVITTFMALLELIKKKQIRIEQEDNYAPIFLFKASFQESGELSYV